MRPRAPLFVLSLLLASCADHANTVEVRHADGTVGLSMHLSSLSVSKGAAVAAGTTLSPGNCP